MRRLQIVWLCGLAFLCGAFSYVPQAQLSLGSNFTTGTTISSSAMNTKMSTIASDALNRTGGTMTGTLLAQQITPVAGATYDLGLTGTRFRHGWFSGDVTATGAGAFGTLTTSNTSATSLDVAGGITAGTGNVAIVDATGKIPALTATYVASLSGASLTGLDEANITDGSVLARVAGTETITGNWTHSGTSTFTGSVTTSVAVFETGVVSPTTITANQNDYAPTGFATANIVRLSSDLVQGYTISGLAGGASGRKVVFCNVNTLGGDDFVFAGESGSSTAANRFAAVNGSFVTLLPGECKTVWYDGVSSRWRIIQ